jgi:hypothetical protein
LFVPTTLSHENIAVTKKTGNTIRVRVGVARS